jgi:acetylornithine deacetylase/succinyl-diaminopimelate desuccinylase-like protein
MPGKDPGGPVVTILIGLAGALLGGWLGSVAPPVRLPEHSLPLAKATNRELELDMKVGRRTGAMVILVCGCSVAAAVPDVIRAQTYPPDEYVELSREIFQELIDINTTNSVGDNTAAAQAMADRLLGAGFDPADVHVIEAAPRKGNLVARLRGRDSGRRPILLLAHIDVVEADPADWNLDPFTFVEQDGFYYGRGTTDDKDEAAIHVANLIRMKREGFVPDRDIVIALTADEEGGPANGVAFLLANHRELIDAEYALNEGGGGVIQNGRRISNTVQAAEKVYQSFRLEVLNPGGHSSLPREDNAIYELVHALTRIQEHGFPVMLNDVSRAYFAATANLVEPQTAAAMRRVLGDPPDPGAVEILSHIPAFNSRMRTTCVATMLAGGHAENALPQRAQAVVNCRIVPGHDPMDVKATLERVADQPGLTVTPMDDATPSPPSPLAPEILQAVERITEEMWPGVPVVPAMSTGATDGLYLRNAGIPVYGVSGLFRDIDDNRAHGQDERIEIRSFFEGMEFLYRLTVELSSADVS